MLELLSLLRRFGVENVSAATNRLVDQGHLAHCFHHGPSQKSKRFQGWGLATYARHRPGFAKPNIVGNGEAGYTQITSALQTDDESVAKEFVRAVHDDENLTVLWQVIDERGYEPLLVRSLKVIAEGNLPQDVFTVDEVVARWSDLHEHLNDENAHGRFEDLIRRLVQQHRLAEDIQERTEGFEPDNSGLYQTIVETVPDIEGFQGWCRNGLKGVTADGWLCGLKDETDLVYLMEQLSGAGNTLDIGHELQDAMVEHAKGILEGTVKPSAEIEGTRAVLVAALENDASRAVLRDRLWPAPQKLIHML